MLILVVDRFAAAIRPTFTGCSNYCQIVIIITGIKQILLIEDNNDIRGNTAAILELSGYGVIIAEDGKRDVE